jgi:hypothetical protein
VYLDVSIHKRKTRGRGKKKRRKRNNIDLTYEQPVDKRIKIANTLLSDEEDKGNDSDYVPDED